jgi:hypothetical protein
MVHVTLFDRNPIRVIKGHVMSFEVTSSFWPITLDGSAIQASERYQ